MDNNQKSPYPAIQERLRKDHGSEHIQVVLNQIDHNQNELELLSGASHSYVDLIRLKEEAIHTLKRNASLLALALELVERQEAKRLEYLSLLKDGEADWK